MRLQDLKQGIASQVTSPCLSLIFVRSALLLYTSYVFPIQIINEENAGGASVGVGDSEDGNSNGGVTKKAGPQFGSALFGSLLLRPDDDD